MNCILIYIDNSSASIDHVSILTRQVTFLEGVKIISGDEGLVSWDSEIAKHWDVADSDVVFIDYSQEPCLYWSDERGTYLFGWSKSRKQWSVNSTTPSPLNVLNK